MKLPPYIVSERIVLAGLACALALLIAIAVMSNHGMQQYRDSTHWVQHTHEVLRELDGVLLHVREAESGNRGFMMTEDTHQLEVFRAAVAALTTQIAFLRGLTSDNMGEQRNLDALENLVAERIQLLHDAQSTTWRSEHTAQERLLAQGTRSTERIYALVDTMKVLESELLVQREDALHRSADKPLWLIVGGTALGAGLLVIVFGMLRIEIGRRGAAQRQAQAYAAEVGDANLFMDSVIENVPIMLFVKDAEHLRFVRFNSAGEALLGHSRAQLLGKNDHDLFPQGEADFFAAKDREVLARGEMVDIPEETIHARDGSTRILHTRKVPVLGGDGVPVYLLGISEDVTERKRAELAMTQLNADLLQRGAQLEAANKELDSFAYSVSHDLRTPLRAISGYAQILEEDYRDSLDGEARRLLDVIRNNTVRMGALIDDLLSFSKLGRARLSEAQIDMKQMVAQVFAEIGKLDAGAAPRLVLHDLAPAVGDPRLLRQVWVNLLSNAAKFSGSRAQAEIEVASERRGAETVYRVRDNGVGFDMNYYNKLFGVFQRLHSAEQFPGTGVGLAIVQRVIARHGGKVWAEGEPDRGATFYFALPHKEENHERHEGS